ncbi:hypothetical protein RFI_10489 [Reticulomyxa filosa]|uniref:Uncharacterized protein n=1 Tax=Reticulomyxa filosa TaxID=46433 RepID=X6NKX0_RETFI|nr:hypothetical protein RFI_10489 [Reticulomyxa filosa]|eukprot:ETO26646.1 hypothetical protein RFI_10489 [Reticulomyxa filosa]
MVNILICGYICAYENLIKISNNFKKRKIYNKLLISKCFLLFACISGFSHFFWFCFFYQQFENVFTLFICVRLFADKRQYQLYRPNYHDTPVIFEQWLSLRNSIDNESDYSTRHMLSQISEVYNQWKSYHDIAKLMIELKSLQSLSQMNPFQNIMKVYDNESKSMQDRTLFRVQITNFHSNPFTTKLHTYATFFFFFKGTDKKDFFKCNYFV